MKIDSIQRGHMIVVQGRPVRVRLVARDHGKIRLEYDGGHISRKPGADIPTRAEIPAGPVQSQPYARTPRVVRVSNGAWPGDRAGTTQERIIGYNKGWDL